MNERPLASLLRRLRSAAALEATPSLSDAELLRRWVEQRDEAAFEVLVWRHGPLVLGVCRRLLHNSQDAEDAFQATFLVLVRKAASLRRGESVGSWLYKVAYRVALRARATAARRAARQRPAVDTPASDNGDDVLWRDLRPILDEEVQRLPDRYRIPFILCYLQGKTNAEAATEVGCPVGTILSRLAWRRERLRGRLTKRGIVLAGTLTAVMIAQNATAAVPAALVEPAVEAAVLTAAGKSAVGALSAQAVQFAEGVLNAMAMTNFTIVASVVLAVAVGLGAGTLALQSQASDDPKPATTRKTPKPDESKDPSPNDGRLAKKNWLDVPSPLDGILTVVGTEIKKDEKVAPEGVIDGKFRKLREGDKVEAGQLLAKLDDRKATEEVRIAEARLLASRAEYEAAVKTRDEADQRYKTMLKLLKNAAISEEELRAGKLTFDRYVQEVEAKKATVIVSEAELRLAAANLKMHEIRSPVNGTILGIHLRAGEAARKLEAVIRIRVAE